MLDISAYDEFKDNPVESDLYWKLRLELNDLLIQNGVLYAYVTDVPAKGETAKILVDAGDENDDTPYMPGDISEGTDYHRVEGAIMGTGSYTDIIIDEEYGEYLSSYAPLKNASGEIIGIVGVDLAASEIQQIQQDTLKATIPVLLLVIIVLSVILIIFLNRYIVRALKPLTYMQDAALQFASGDLNGAEETISGISLKQENEISDFAKAFRKSVEQLKLILTNMNGTASSLVQVSDDLDGVMKSVRLSNDDISTSIYQIAAGSEVQKTNNDEALTAMEEMTVGIQRIADSSTAVASSSNEMTELVNSSVMDSQKVIGQIKNVENSVLATEGHVKVLGEKYQSIEEMVKVITGIADQTNLLALNAAIEAA
ncbi:MAG: methyl-accepting chemotaxis protein, partial [Kurthia sp.]